MSGALRRLIGPANTRLRTALDVLPRNFSLAADPTLAEIEDSLLVVNNHLNKISKIVESMESYQSEWLQLIITASKDKAAAEEKLFEEFSTSNNFVEIYWRS
uniref:Uncharacterized protein n=1 Tax=Ditylenchus dipsaci TaxID=166011 RepID=A0A915EEG9_9BILA